MKTIFENNGGAYTQVGDIYCLIFRCRRKKKKQISAFGQ
jgi:hypothetical protein